MKHCVKLAVAAAIAASTLLMTSSTAWASPCASGERIVGKTDSAWLCMNVGSGVIREVAF